jgi:hypothetical protein
VRNAHLYVEKVGNVTSQSDKIKLDGLALEIVYFLQKAESPLCRIRTHSLGYWLNSIRMTSQRGMLGSDIKINKCCYILTRRE